MLIENVINAGDIAGKSQVRVITVKPNDSVRDAIQILDKHSIGLVVVCNEDGSLAGVFSERDVIRALSRHGEGIIADTVASLMTVDVITCGPKDDPNAVIRAMNNGHFRHMPVIEDGRVIGVVSSKDIFAHMASVLSPSECQDLWKQTLWV